MEVTGFVSGRESSERAAATRAESAVSAHSGQCRSRQGLNRQHTTGLQYSQFRYSRIHRAPRDRVESVRWPVHPRMIRAAGRTDNCVRCSMVHAAREQSDVGGLELDA